MTLNKINISFMTWLIIWDINTVSGLGFRSRLRSVSQLRNLDLPWGLDDKNDISNKDAHLSLFPANQPEVKPPK